MMVSSSKSSPPKENQQLLGKQETPDWLELPSDIMAKILSRLCVIDILENAQKVCIAWHKICNDPAIWRVIDMDFFKIIKAWRDIYMDGYLDLDEVSLADGISTETCKRAVDRSQGQSVDITIVGFYDDELLQYVAERSSQLRHLDIAHCFSTDNQSWFEALKKFPLLEELRLYSTPISKKAIEIVGRCCPMLKTLKANLYSNYAWCGGTRERITDEIAIAIGKNLCELRHLEFIGDSLTNIGVQAILDGCGHLESFDLSQCYNLYLEEGLEKRCNDQIKCLKLPSDILRFDDYDEYSDENIEYDEYRDKNTEYDDDIYGNGEYDDYIYGSGDYDSDYD